jgi:hypothetical protein
MEITALIREFSEQAGIEDVSALDGIWRFSADGNVFGVLADESGEKVLLFGELPAPVPEKAEAFRTAILEANYFFNGTGGGTLSVNPKTGAYTLVQAERLDRMDAVAFFSLVEKFVNTLATWRTIAETGGEEPPRQVEERVSFESFMRV